MKGITGRTSGKGVFKVKFRIKDPGCAMTALLNESNFISV